MVHEGLFWGSLVLKTKVSKIISGVMRRHEGLTLEPGSLGIDPRPKLSTSKCNWGFPYTIKVSEVKKFK